MDSDHLKELLEKVANGSATDAEKLEALRQANDLIVHYNRLLKEALAQNPT